MIYERRASPLHAARAAVAAAWSMALVTFALLTEHPLILGTLIAVCLAAAAAAGVGRQVARMARFAVPFAVLIALINPLVVREGLTVVWRFGEIPPFGQIDVTREALVYGALLGLRAMVVLLGAALFAATVDPDGLLRLFRRVSLRSALTAALAVRLVPVLARDGRRLAEAGRCRTDQPGRVAVLRAVTAGALDRAADVAATLEVRGYATHGGAHASALRQPWSRHDTAFTASAVAILVLALSAELAGIGAVTAYPRTEIAFGAREVALAALLALVALLPFADRKGVER